LDFDNIDSCCALLTNKPSLRKSILAMITQPKVLVPGAPAIPPGPVFLSVDPATRHSNCGSFVVTYTIDNALGVEES
jgi:hypothetical protein